MAFPGAILPTSSWNPGLTWPWQWRKAAYQRFQSQTISCVPFLSGAPAIYTSSVEVATQMFSPRPEIRKDPHANEILRLWGENVLSTNHDMHKRHRRVAGSAFNGSIYTLVAQETAALYYEMMDSEDWTTQSTVSVTGINRYMSKFALGIISRCGFGLPFPWVSNTTLDGMTFDEALLVVAKASIIRVSTPRWAYKLPIENLKKIDKAYITLAEFMKRLISAKKEEFEAHGDDTTRSRPDLLTKLVGANASESEKTKLSDEELVGNVFTFMFAGHETTSVALTASMALLALHPEEQDGLVSHIQEVIGEDRMPNLTKIEALYKVLACFQEAVRMFPGAALLTRDTTDTITLNVPNDEGAKPIVVEAGVRLVIDMIGIHYNPRLFPDPERFDPTRWYGARDSDLTFFGWGHRVCLGRKFSMTEATCFLSLLLRDWKIEPILQNGESLALWRERVLQMGMRGLAFGVGDAPLKLTKRVKA
ncbi:cytochrome P450 [Neolentinus lepideus HHB14362 ss-1]|uniref:Cytochrome P450 n=1 Tax=Neolentinus lepideus HHB14362 ss-1 TaxID=1314782 RepID=A0A165NYU3_9AGAM|nr:cytochrome P450 [Neolentinus lepideus HHB14362 ss-1]